MVADFTSLKPVGKWIMASLDHAMIVAEGDLSLIDWLKRNQQKYFVVNSNPTSEVIAKVIFAQAQALGFELATVTVSETCTASATFSKK
jgi:6-pyruvoyl-tetrahydropterin synthase